jgi:hypothetical protein
MMGEECVLKWCAPSDFDMFACNCFPRSAITQVHIPRRMYYHFRWRAEQERLHFEAWTYNHLRHDAMFEVKRCLAVQQVLLTRIPDTHELRPHLDVMFEVPWFVSLPVHSSPG